jgi:hypothetical protein
VFLLVWAIASLPAFLSPRESLFLWLILVVVIIVFDLIFFFAYFDACYLFFRVDILLFDDVCRSSIGFLARPLVAELLDLADVESVHIVDKRIKAPRQANRLVESLCW